MVVGALWAGFDLFSLRRHIVLNSNSNAVRFVAYFAHGFDGPLTHLLLGYGFGNQGGRSHRSLMSEVGQDHLELAQCQTYYAGYLGLRGDTVVISGGSMTLSITQNKQLDSRILDALLPQTSLGVQFRQVAPKIMTSQIQAAFLNA